MAIPIFAANAVPEIPKIESIGVLYALLPGLLAVVTYRRFAGARKKMEATETAVIALAYTIVCHATWQLLTMPSFTFVPVPDLLGLSLCGVFWGVLVAVDVSNDWSFSILRKKGLVATSTHSTVWIGAIHDFGKVATVELADGRTIYGIITRASMEQKDGHLVIARAVWIHQGVVQENREGVVQENQDAGTTMIRGNDVKLIQFH